MNPRLQVALAASVVLATSLLAGCGDVSNEPTGPGGTGAAGAGGPGGSGASGATGGGGGSGGDACESFLPPRDFGVEPVTVRFVNKTAANIFLGEENPGCDIGAGFTLADGAKPLKPSRGACEFTCADLQSSGCECPAGCAAPVVTLVAPGGAASLQWLGTVFETQNMPAECFQEPTCGPACLVESVPTSKPLTFGGSAWTGIDCGIADCTCMPDASGTCIISSGPAIVTGTKLDASATWTGEAQIDVIFQ